tara:strand:- start:138458 stop:142159 length:3702 start_codon:yes stop_codon:yes gene_type:complete
MSKLTRFIAIDNISREQIVEIATSDHTNFNGVIRAGKTTTLRAMLLFYGARPGDIAKAKGGAFESFANFYFPNPSSFLVYEYEKGDKIYCVIVSGKMGQVRYQFLDTAFDKTFFLHQEDGQTKLADIQQLRVAVEAKNHELTSLIGSDTYTNVIQSNKMYRGKGANAEQIRRLRPKYSLPVNGGSIENIERVLSNIFASKASVANIRNALTNVLIQEGAIAGRILKLDDQASEVSEWVDDRQAWIDLEKRRETVLALKQTSADYTAVGNKLSGLKARCDEVNQKTSDSIIKSNEMATHYEGQLNAIGNERRDYLEKTNETETELYKQKNNLSHQIAIIVQQKSDFEEGSADDRNFRPIVDLIALHNSVGSLGKAEQDAKNFYEKVSQGNQNITHLYEQHRAYLDTQKMSLVSDVNNLKANSLIQLDQDKADASVLFEDRRKNLERLWESRIKSADKQVKTTMMQHTKLEVELYNIKATEKTEVELTELYNELNQGQRDYGEAVLEFSKFTTAQMETQKLYDRNLAASVTLREKRAKLKEEQKDLQSRIGSGTLFDFLSENVESFEKNIGKVISPTLLSMKGLSPTFEEGGQTVFGLGLNLEAIPNLEIKDESSITNRIVILDEELAKIESKLGSLEQELQKSHTQVKQLTVDLRRAQFNKRTIEDFIKETDVALKELNLKKNDEIERFTEETKAAHRKAGEAYAKANAELKTLRQDAVKEFQTLNSEHQSNIETINIAHQTLMTSYEKLMVDGQIAIDEKRSKFDSQEKVDLEAQGCNPQTIINARTMMEKAEKAHRDGRNAGERVGRYNKFMTKEWIKHSPLTRELETVQVRLKTHLDEVKKKKQNLAEIKSIIEDKKKVNEQQIEALLSQLHIMQGLEREFTKINLEADSSRGHLFKSADAQECRMKFNSLTKDHADYALEGRSKFNIIKQTFNRKAGTQTFKFFDRLMAEQASIYSTNDMWWGCAPLLQEYLDGEHLVQSDLLRTRYLLVAQGIVDFSSQIKAAHEALNSLGRKLTSAMKGVAEPFEAIGELDISVASNLRSLSYYSVLERYSLEHDSWKIHSGTEMPDDHLIAKLANLIDMLGSKTLSVDVEKSFQFEIILNEDGKEKIAKTDDEIENISSNGTSYLVILSLYIGLINMMRTDNGVQLHFCIDELGRIDTDSSGKLIEILDKQNIKMFSALPVESAELLQHYPNCYMIESVGANKRRYSLYGPDSKVTIHDKLASVLEE